MGRLAKDAKELIIGKDGSDKEPKDFKTELDEAIKSGIVTKADGTLLMTARINADKLGSQILKDQEKDIDRSFKDKREFDTLEEAIEDKKEKDRKEEERKRREREAAMQAAKATQKQVSTKKVTEEKQQTQITEPEKEIIDEKR